MKNDDDCNNEPQVSIIINGDENNIIYLPQSLYDDCEAMAKKRGITFDEFLSEAIQYMISLEKNHVE